VASNRPLDVGRSTSPISGVAELPKGWPGVRGPLPKRGFGGVTPEKILKFIFKIMHFDAFLLGFELLKATKCTTKVHKNNGDVRRFNDACACLLAPVL